MRILVLGLFLSVVSFASADRQLGSQCQINPAIDGGLAMQAHSPLDIRYLGNESLRYSGASPQPFTMIVFHDPGSNNCDPIPMVRYGQTYDSSRGGIFGYHFYIALDGTIYQGAPMNKRTNHVSGSSRRTNLNYSNSNAIGISLMCGHRQIPQAQLDAAKRLGHAIQVAYQIPSNRIVGHGELQTNRSPNEGLVAARATRESQPSGQAQVKYSMQGQNVLCQVNGPVPPGCTGNGCDIFAQSTGVQGAQTGPASFYEPMRGNTGYQLPQESGSAGSGSAGVSPQGAGNKMVTQPTTVAGGKQTKVPKDSILTDSQDWGYPLDKPKTKQKSSTKNLPFVKTKRGDSDTTANYREDDTTPCGPTTRGELVKRFNRTKAFYEKNFKNFEAWEDLAKQRVDEDNRRAAAYARTLVAQKKKIDSCPSHKQEH